MRHGVIGAAAALAAGILLGAPARAQSGHYTIAVSLPTADHGWTGGLLYDAKQEAALLEHAYPGLTVIVKPSASAADQASALEDLTAGTKPDALVVLPYDSSQLTGAVRRVKAKGVFITVVDRGLTDPAIQDLYVAGDNPEFGRVAGKYFVQKLGHGDVVVMRGIPTVVDSQRVAGFQQAIAGSGVKILDMQFANWSRDEGFKVMQDFLAKHAHIDAVWAADDDVAQGALRAIAQAKRSDIRFVVGGAGMREVIKGVMDGNAMMPVDVSYPPSMMKTAIDLTVAHLVSKAAVRGTFLLSTVLITKDNASEYYDPNSPF
ncbi:substrate-binding domain-containing protein [Lichenicoccus roseus]|uniref:Substrate-binding domain-containing protein n=1 Tax=Lichenicoccus roseus TaxID=2683649 RepID=A0A5R9J4R1_9PROT|nr:substrate-binding domain-containing protein [Lichenicoccus roseus]TLU72604.1 substrate-binding domain-containing protein [Lichenicoccus roseus]